MRTLSVFLVLTGLLASPFPATAQLRPLVDAPESASAALRDGVEVFLVNEGAAPVAADAPAAIDAIARDGTRLRLFVTDAPPAVIAPGGFVRRRYRLEVAAAARGIPDVAAAAPAKSETLTRSSNGTSAAFLDRFHPNEPIYGVFDTGDSGGKLQLSFAFRVLGHEDRGPRLTFGYTQTMLWAIDKPSGPIGPTTYSPELFVDLPVGRSTIVGLGYRHDSNGQGTAGSIDANRLVLRATRTVDLGDDWQLDLTPQAWLYVGTRGTARDLDRYWGYSGLGIAIGKVDGLKLEATARGNPGTGKGSAEVFLSYPIVRQNVTGLGFYVFGQAFTGYGESLDTYDRRDGRARLGIAFTR